MSTPIIDEAAKVFADPTSYADEPRLHAALTRLRPRTGVAHGSQQVLHRVATAAQIHRAERKPELIATTFVGGLKHLPIRYELV